MESMYACLILHNAGMPITEDSLEKVLVAAGVEPDVRSIQALVAVMGEIDIDAVISAPFVPVSPEISTPEPKQKPKIVEPEVEDMGFGLLFGKPPKEEEEEKTGLSALFGK